MSSIESDVTEIEELYAKLVKEMESHVSPNERTAFGFERISEGVLLDLIRKTMSLQRRLEYSLNSTMKLFEKSVNTNRLQEIAKTLVSFFTSFNDLGFPQVNFVRYVNFSTKCIGIIPQLRRAHSQLIADDYDFRNNCYCAYLTLKNVKPTLIEFEEEMRLIAALGTYPIAKKMVLKNQLVTNGFDQVAVSLEQAESNAEISHFKDAVSRCRDAVEIFIATIRERETQEKTAQSFSNDLAKIGKIGVFDEAVQRLAQGVYSFLSLKGSHNYDATKVTVYDAETSLQETYSLIEMLFKKMSEYQKKK